jgi:hypothetical protein
MRYGTSPARKMRAKISHFRRRNRTCPAIMSCCRVDVGWLALLFARPLAGQPADRTKTTAGKVLDHRPINI